MTTPQLRFVRLRIALETMEPIAPPALATWQEQVVLLGALATARVLALQGTLVPAAIQVFGLSLCPLETSQLIIIISRFF